MSELTQVLRHVLPSTDPNALVDVATGDDAAVYRLDAERALVVSLDFFSPVVDDPATYGRIAAANALSDVYAMGGRPLFALNIVGFPRDLLGEGVLEEIVRGGAETCRQAGIPVLGGHSVDDVEPKFGLVAVGEVEPASMVTNAGARPGQALVATKALGTGVVTTALKADQAPPEVTEAAVRSMTTLNREAASAMVAAGVTGATDISGFGLLGHLRALLRASGAAAEVEADRVPLLPGARELAEAGHVPGGTRRNLDDLEPDLTTEPGISPTTRVLLADAQTSGGLLMAVDPERLDELLRRLDATPGGGAQVGRITEGRGGSIRVV
jgi:selenide,water dikinase